MTQHSAGQAESRPKCPDLNKGTVKPFLESYFFALFASLMYLLLASLATAFGNSLHKSNYIRHLILHAEQSVSLKTPPY